jgi:hypothetical protein
MHLSADVPKSAVESKGLKGIIYESSFTDMHCMKSCIHCFDFLMRSAKLH